MARTSFFDPHRYRSTTINSRRFTPVSVGSPDDIYSFKPEDGETPIFIPNLQRDLIQREDFTLPDYLEESIRGRSQAQVGALQDAAYRSASQAKTLSRGALMSLLPTALTQVVTGVETQNPYSEQISRFASDMQREATSLDSQSRSLAATAPAEDNFNIAQQRLAVDRFNFTNKNEVDLKNLEISSANNASSLNAAVEAGNMYRTLKQEDINNRYREAQIRSMEASAITKAQGGSGSGSSKWGALSTTLESLVLGANRDLSDAAGIKGKNLWTKLFPGDEYDEKINSATGRIELAGTFRKQFITEWGEEYIIAQERLHTMLKAGIYTQDEHDRRMQEYSMVDERVSDVTALLNGITEDTESEVIEKVTVELMEIMNLSSSANTGISKDETDKSFLIDPKIDQPGAILQTHEDLGKYSDITGDPNAGTRGSEQPIPAHKVLPGMSSGSNTMPPANARISTPDKTFTPELQVSIDKHTELYEGMFGDIDIRDYMYRISQIESSGGHAKDREGSEYVGPFQIGTSVRTEFERTLEDTLTTDGNTKTALELSLKNFEYLSKKLGREPTGPELYFAHQQGRGGASSLLTRPDELAQRVRSLEAIRSNLPRSKRHMAETVTSEAFYNHYADLYNAAKPAPGFLPSAGTLSDDGSSMMLDPLTTGAMSLEAFHAQNKETIDSGNFSFSLDGETATTLPELDRLFRGSKNVRQKFIAKNNNAVEDAAGVLTAHGLMRQGVWDAESIEFSEPTAPSSSVRNGRMAQNVTVDIIINGKKVGMIAGVSQERVREKIALLKRSHELISKATRDMGYRIATGREEMSGEYQRNAITVPGSIALAKTIYVIPPEEYYRKQ